MTYADKTAWVTGASSGIGEAVARRLAADGARLILSGRRAAALERLAGELACDSLVLPFEATDYGGLPAAVETAWGWSGGVDLLFNNAGVSQRSLAIDTEFSVYRTLMEIDFFAPVRLTTLNLPRMVERRRGQIAVVSSVAGKLGAPLRTGYCAAKHACVGYFEALRAEVAAYGVDVNVVVPGSVRTAVAVNALAGDGQVRGRSDANIDAGMDPAEAAERIVSGLARGEPEVLVVQGAEAEALRLRSADPQAVFALMAREGSRLAEAREAASAG